MKTLIIEDDAETAAFIAAGLRSRGYEPTLAANGREGFEIAAHETFDVIILDRMLPGLDGLSVVALLRAGGVLTPVLFLRNLSGVDNRVEGLGAGGDDYLVKPFAFEGVLETFDALLRIGQIEAGARRAGFQNVDLAQIARDVVDAFRPAAEEQGRTLVAHLDEPLPLQGDLELLTQMIANCLDNALTHTPPGVRIEVEGTRGSTGARLSVADIGPGVPQGDLAKLFDRFFRSDVSRTSPGSGLGLSLVAAIAELHGLVCSASDNRPGLKVTVAAMSSHD
jgi:CheY-like chemotaxis protein